MEIEMILAALFGPAFAALVVGVAFYGYRKRTRELLRQSDKEGT